MTFRVVLQPHAERDIREAARFLLGEAEGGAGWTRFDGDEAMRLMGCLPDRESVRAADEDIVQAYRHAHRVLREAPDEVFEDAHTELRRGDAWQAPAVA